jgi:hypothetical protein
MTIGKMCVAVTALALIAGAAHATGTPALSTPTNSAGTLSNPPFTLGWEFQANAPVVVSELGVFDSDQDGLTDSYAVGLWNSSGTLLASTTVAAGTVDPLIAQFRYNSVTPVALTSGADYFIGALYTTGDDGVLFPGSAETTDPRITYLQSEFTAGGTLSMPTSTGGAGGYFGPNFTIGGGVPEPATWAFLIAGFGMVGAGMRRRSARVAIATA